jgi:hypothetical protein
MGALNIDRLRHFLERYHSMPPADPSSGIPPPFMYGTHYSTPGYVLHYLVRVAPEFMLCLQNGKYDAPDRIFHSVGGSFDSCVSNPADLKELIPEFFCGNGEFLMNMDDLDLGHRHTGERLNDVELPPWADSPRDFIRKHAKALESEYVSERLHLWIDLIFGCKQQGRAAVEAHNLFYYLTYEGAVDLEAIKNETERNALQIQIEEFGQTPKQLFTYSHPRRSDTEALLSLIAKGNNAESYETPSSGFVASYQSKPASSSFDSNTTGAPSISTADNLPAAKASSRGADRPLSTEQQKVVFQNISAGVLPEIEELERQDIAIVRLDEDFSLEVQRELEHQRRSTPKSVSAVGSPGSGKDDNAVIAGGSSEASKASTITPSPTTSGKSVEHTGRETSPSNIANSAASSRNAVEVPSESAPMIGTSGKSTSRLSVFGSWGDKTASFLDKTFGSSLSSTLTSSTNTTPSGHSTKSSFLGGGGSNSLGSTGLAVKPTVSSPSEKVRGDGNNATPVNSSLMEPTRGRNNDSDGISCGAVQAPPPPVASALASTAGPIISGELPGQPTSIYLRSTTQPFFWHGASPISCVSACLSVSATNTSSARSSMSGAGRGLQDPFLATMDQTFNSDTVFSLVICSTSRDSYMKVTHVLEQIPSNIQSRSGDIAAPLLLSSSTRRSYSPGESPTTACCMTRDGTRVLLASWDNNIYRYML